MSLRTALFWLHLVSGVIAGAVILLMSVTGVALTYERQMIAWADGAYGPVPSTPDSRRLPVADLIDLARRVEGSGTPSTLTVRHDAAAPVVVGFGRDRALFVDPYTGAVLGEGSVRTRAFFSALRSWHRWLAAEGDSRWIGRAITGACNLAFLVLVLTGPVLWWPRKLSWRHVRAGLAFSSGLRGRARDFNWHTVIGIWTTIPLLLIVASGVMISYPWASNLVYRVAGEEPPRRGGPPGGGGDTRPAENPPPVVWAGLDALLARAEGQLDDWRTITMQVPPGDAPVRFTIDQGTGGEPHKRHELVLDRSSSGTLQWIPASSRSAGQRLRSFLRFAHTGEVAGLVGQTVAGLVSAGAVVMVWTGLALAWRRGVRWVRTPGRGPAQRAVHGAPASHPTPTHAASQGQSFAGESR